MNRWTVRPFYKLLYVAYYKGCSQLNSTSSNIWTCTNNGTNHRRIQVNTKQMFWSNISVLKTRYTHTFYATLFDTFHLPALTLIEKWHHQNIFVTCWQTIIFFYLSLSRNSFFFFRIIICCRGLANWIGVLVGIFDVIKDHEKQNQNAWQKVFLF